MMGFGSQALLAPVWGALADAVGVRTTLLIAGFAAASVTTLIGLSWFQFRGQEEGLNAADSTAAVPSGVPAVSPA